MADLSEKEIIAAGIVIVVVVLFSLTNIDIIEDFTGNENSNDYEISIIYRGHSPDELSVGKTANFHFTIENKGKAAVIMNVTIKMNDSILVEDRNVTLSVIDPIIPLDKRDYNLEVVFEKPGMYLFNVTTNSYCNGKYYYKMALFTTSV